MNAVTGGDLLTWFAMNQQILMRANMRRMKFRKVKSEQASES